MLRACKEVEDATRDRTALRICRFKVRVNVRIEWRATGFSWARYFRTRPAFKTTQINAPTAKEATSETQQRQSSPDLSDPN